MTTTQKLNMKTLQDSEQSEDIRGAVALLIFWSFAGWSILCDWRAKTWWWLTVPTVCNWYHKDVRTLHFAPLKCFGHLTSHDMCPECSVKWQAQVRAMTKAK